MTEYQFKNAKVRVHGTPDPDNLKAATQKFLKQAEAQKKKAAEQKNVKITYELKEST